MKVTLDLPKYLIRRLIVRSDRVGQKPDAVAADILRNGLGITVRSRKKRKPVEFAIDETSGFPVIVGRKVRRRGHSLTPAEIAQLLLDQETEWTLAAFAPRGKTPAKV